MQHETKDFGDVQTIVKAIKKHELVDFFAVPKELRSNLEVVKAERKARIRKSTTRGYDVIRQQFFVEELVNRVLCDGTVDKVTYSSAFESFDDYYAFLEGDIYEKACYYQYFFSKSLIKKYEIDVSKINYDSLLDDSVDDCFPERANSLDENYELVEVHKRNVKRWITKYNNCKTFAELSKVNENHRNSSDDTDELFFLWNYINTYGESAFDIIMDFVNAGAYPAYHIENALPFIFDAQRAEDAYDYKGGAKSTCTKHNAKFKAFLKRVKEGYTVETSKYYSNTTHFFCVRTDYFFVETRKFRFPCASTYSFFEDFPSFAVFLNKDLSDCDLMYCRDVTIDSSFVVNENTVLPIEDVGKLKKIVEKKYNRYNDDFEVRVLWVNDYGKAVFRERRTFKRFFDFLSYLKGDLSNADLLFCDGLSNLKDYSEIDFTQALLTSSILDKLSVQYKRVYNPGAIPIDNEMIIKNEKDTALIFRDEHDELPVDIVSSSTLYSDNKVYYISDIHLIHKIIRKEAKTSEDILCITQRVIDDMLADFDAFWIGKTILIGGDVSSDFSFFELFVKLLRKTIDELSYDVTVIFVLGNHEFWNHEGKSVDDIVDMYRGKLSDYGMYLLHDEILSIGNSNAVSYISKEELIALDKGQVREKVRQARLILFGGVGFAGCNDSFNANNGIYRETITRKQELELSEKFSNLYSRVEDVLGDKKLIVFTHMSIREWRKENELHDKWIYVSGHNHRNTYYDDGSTRVYADNQIGYYNTLTRLKYFLIDNSYDWFSDYDDGIYEITKEDYVEFYRGKNIPITFNRDVPKLFMLKRDNYYCFIMEGKSGNLTMLNGGALKKLPYDDINYYYENMQAQIKYLKTPLLKYQEFQQKISDEIRKIGGSGRIHGAIIDIDGNDELGGWNSIAYNHLYVNPVDMTITPYYATDMVLKYVYPSFQALISDKCPKLYENYNKLITGEEKNAIIIKQTSKEELRVKPILYTDTDIYKASRELRKMQKLNSNILSTWLDNVPSDSVPSIKTKVINHITSDRK